MNTLGVAAGEASVAGRQAVTAADIKVGERVMVETIEKDGKAIATLVLLGEMSM